MSLSARISIAAAVVWLCSPISACSTAHHAAAGPDSTDSALKKLPDVCRPVPARVSHERWERPENCAAILDPPSQPAESEESWQRLMRENRLACNLDEELRAFVAARRSCAVDAECTLLFSHCVFGCDIPVAAGQAGEVEAKLQELKERYKAQGFSCAHECRRATAVACDRGSCVNATPDCEIEY